MAQYNSKIENGIKSALFSLDDLMTENHIIDPELFQIREKLWDMVIKAQCGKIEFVEVLEN